MKKHIFLWIGVIILTLSGCTTKPLPIDPITTEFLNTKQIENSTIQSIDFEAVDHMHFQAAPIPFSSISARIQEVLLSHYTFFKKADPIAIGDAVTVDFTIQDGQDHIVYAEQNAIIFVGIGLFDQKLEAALLDHATDGSIVVQLGPEFDNQFSTYSSDHHLQMKIRSVEHYTALPDTQQTLEDQNIHTFEEFYRSLYDMKAAELSYESNAEQQNSFLQAAIHQSQFFISVHDQKQYAVQVLREWEQAASSFGISLEEYHAAFLQQAQGSVYDFATQTAEYEIQKYLLIGALAQHKQIQIDEESFSTFCIVNHITNQDKELLATAKYMFLEQAVLQHYLNLQANHS